MGGAPVAIASTRHEEPVVIKSLVPAHQFGMNLNRPPPFDKEEVGPTQPQTGAVNGIISHLAWCQAVPIRSQARH